jgi:hypothetical protein
MPAENAEQLRRHCPRRSAHGHDERADDVEGQRESGEGVAGYVSFREE